MPIQNVSTHKILGVFVERSLNWNSQVDQICAKLNSKLYLLKRIVYYLTFEMKKMYYNAYLLSTLDYCCTIWGKNAQSTVKKMTTFQKRAARIILNKPMKTPSKDLFTELKWMFFSDRCKYHTAVMVFKFLNKGAPKYLSESLKFSNNPSYQLRSSSRNDLIISNYKTKYYKDSFTYYSARIWNDIPVDIRNIRTINGFKTNYRQYLLHLAANL